MLNISKEKFEKLLNEQRRLLNRISIISVVSFFLCFVFFGIRRRSDGVISHIFLLAEILSIVLPFTMIALVRKKIIPQGNGKIVMEMYKQFRNDLFSDTHIIHLYNAIGRASNPADRIKLQLMLADTYFFREQINEAINVLGTVDRTEFRKYPNVGMSFYEEIISVYSVIGDSDSVLKAYEDGRGFVEESAEYNFICYSTAVSLTIGVEKARGNYRQALDLRLMMNELMNKYNNQSDIKNQPKARIDAFIRGITFFETAELFYLCGDLNSAAQSLDMGGPLLTDSPLMIKKANELSQSIKDGLSMQRSEQK